MAFRFTQPDRITILIENANWAWPQAVTNIFQPRGISALVAQSTSDAVRLIRNNRIHLAIIDASELQPSSPNVNRSESAGLNLLRTIHNQHRLVPCIVLAEEINDRILNHALALGAFSVLKKPVDLNLLANRIDRLFAKLYDSSLMPKQQPPPENPSA